MALNFGLFPPLTAEVSDAGALSTSYNDNLIRLAVVSGNLDVGSIQSMYDNDTTTYLATSSPPTTPGERDILITLNKAYKNCLYTLLYSAYHPGGSGQTTVTFQDSDDNINWTDLSETTITTGETAVNISGVISCKYFRLKVVTTYNGAAGCGGKIYELSYIERR